MTTDGRIIDAPSVIALQRFALICTFPQPITNSIDDGGSRLWLNRS
jgi:hypothetical protein